MAKLLFILVHRIGEIIYLGRLWYLPDGLSSELYKIRDNFIPKLGKYKYSDTIFNRDLKEVFPNESERLKLLSFGIKLSRIL